MSKYEDVVNLALRRSLFYPASEIYADHPAGFYDFGPYGASIKRKIIDVWRKELLQREDFLEIEGSVGMPSKVFKASGHLDSFNDPITVCEKCKSVHRADKLLSDITREEFKEAQSNEELTIALRDNDVVCPHCKGKLSDVEKSSLMVKAVVGVSSKDSDVFLRPETCQSIFLDFARLFKTMRVKLPKGMSQVGLAFRNEISPRQTLIRSVEFSQMESEVFFDPEKIDEIDGWDKIKDYEVMIQKADENVHKPIKASDLVKHKLVSGNIIAYYLARTQQYFEALGLKKENMRFRELDGDERAFYAKEAFDFEVNTSIGWLELVANNYRTDHDLKGHMEGSKHDLQVVDDSTGRKFIPHVWEISIGTNRTFYAVLENSLQQIDDRVVLSLPPSLAPLHAGVFPLLSNKPELLKKAKEIFDDLSSCFEVTFDKAGSIGKRYARLDEIGVPLCITVDFDSIEKDDVTIRDRDSAEQKRVPVKNLKDILFKILTGVKFSDL